MSRAALRLARPCLQRRRRVHIRENLAGHDQKDQTKADGQTAKKPLKPKFSTVWKTFSRFFHAMEKYFPHCGKTGLFFPRNGKTFSDFSTQWKNFGRFFHTMEKVFGIFPHNGKNVSTVWKTRF